MKTTDQLFKDREDKFFEHLAFYRASAKRYQLANLDEDVRRCEQEYKTAGEKFRQFLKENQAEIDASQSTTNP